MAHRFEIIASLKEVGVEFTRLPGIILANIIKACGVQIKSIWKTVETDTKLTDDCLAVIVKVHEIEMKDAVVDFSKLTGDHLG